MTFTLKRSSSSYHRAVLKDPRGIQRDYKIQLQSLFGCLLSGSLSVHHQNICHPWLGEIYNSLQYFVIVLNSLEFLHSSFPQGCLLGDICRLCRCSCRTILLCTFHILKNFISDPTHNIHHSVTIDPPPPPGPL